MADYWHSVIEMNNWQRQRFSDKIISELFNTVTGKKITFFGFAFKKNTGDTRESPAIYIAKHLLEEHAHVCIYDPKVAERTIRFDLGNLFDQKTGSKHSTQALIVCLVDELVTVYKCPYEAAKDAHAIVVITEWDEFKVVCAKTIIT